MSSTRLLPDDPNGQRTPVREDSPTVERVRLMAELSIFDGGHYYHCLGYRYENLADAIAYAQLVRARIAPQPSA